MRRATRTLLLHCLRLDVVEGAGAGESTLLSGVLYSVLVGLVAGLPTHGLRLAEEVPLAFLLIGLFAVFDGVGDAATAFLDARDVPLLRMLPIRSEVYLRSRVLALQLPLCIKSLALSLPLALSISFARASAAPLAIVPVVAMMQFFFTSASIFLLFASRGIAPAFISLRDHLIWARVVLLVGALGTWLVFFRGGESRVAQIAAGWPLPTDWFANLALLLLRDPGAQPAHALAALAGCAVAFGALVLLAPGYVRLLDGLERTPPARAWPQPLRRACELAFVHPAERPTFRLGVALLRRERTFRLQTYPLLAYPLLFLFMGRGANDGGLFAFLFANFPAVVLRLAVAFLRHSDSESGGFWSACFAGVRGQALASGTRKALWFAIVLPLELVVTLLLISDRGLAFGLAAGSAALAISTYFVVTSTSPEPFAPFSLPFRGRIRFGDEGSRLYLEVFLLVAVALVETALAQAGTRGLSALAGAGVAMTGVLLSRRPPAGTTQVRLGIIDEAVPQTVRNRLPFPVRLKRELLGVAGFFGLLTAGLLIRLLVV